MTRAPSAAIVTLSRESRATPVQTARWVRRPTTTAIHQWRELQIPRGRRPRPPPAVLTAQQRAPRRFLGTTHPGERADGQTDSSPNEGDADGGHGPVRQ